MSTRHGKRWLAGVLGATLCLSGWSGLGLAFQAVQTGSKIPTFTLTGIDGGQVSVSAGGEQVIVLAFVRQGQEKSTDALAELQKLSADHPDQVAVVAVVVNPGEGDAAAWARGAGAGYPVLLDTDGAVYGLYGVRVMPSTGVAKADGTLVGTDDGFTRGFRDEIEHLIQVALGNAQAGEAADTASAEPAKSEARKLAERDLEKAKLLVKRKMSDKAVGSAEAAVAADGEYVAARVFLGELLLESGGEDGAKAQAHFEKALELEPKNLEAKVGMARVKALAGDTASAIALLEQAVLLNPKPERVYYELGRIHESSGDFQQAVEAYRKALERLLR